jgi:hypothetical protein
MFGYLNGKEHTSTYYGKGLGTYPIA